MIENLKLTRANTYVENIEVKSRRKRRNKNTELQAFVGYQCNNY